MPEFGSFDPQGKGFAQTLDVMGATQSMMQRAEAAKRAQAQFEYQQIQNELNAPIEAAQRDADLSKALSERQMQEMTQRTRTQMYPKLAQMQQDLDGVMSLEDDEQRANHALELLKRYSQMVLVPELKPISDNIAHIATSIINDYNKTSVLGNTLRDIEKQRKGGFLTEEQAKQAKEVAAGIQAKATTAKYTTKPFTLPNGSQVLVAVNNEDPTDVRILGDQSQAAPSQQTQQAGAVPAPTAPATATRQPDLIGATTEQKAQQAAAAKLAATLPQRRQNLEYAKSKLDSFLQDIDELIDLTDAKSTGLPSQVSSHIAGTPAYSYRAKLDSLKSRIGLDALTALRNASPTGGGLGNITNKENELLQSTLGAIDQGLKPDELRNQLKKIKERSQNLYSKIESGFIRDFPSEENYVAGVKGIENMSDAELESELKSLDQPK